MKCSTKHFFDKIKNISLTYYRAYPRIHVSIPFCRFHHDILDKKPFNLTTWDFLEVHLLKNFSAHTFHLDVYGIVYATFFGICPESGNACYC